MSYIGYKRADFETPHAKFFKEEIATVQWHIDEALRAGLLAKNTLFPIERINELMKNGYQTCETGYAFSKEGDLRIAVLTKMPRVSPAMWDWWFGWHGCQSNRYKLWHPKAHLQAQWKDGGNELAYLNRTSEIEEYIGTSLEKAAIQFVEPKTLGFLQKDVADKSKNVLICARIGFRDIPVDFGWLIHQIRQTNDGAEMRSRFFIGGQHIQLRYKGILAKAGSFLLQKVIPLSPKRGHDLLLHCGEEMNHLAQFLPEIYAEMKK